jgi:hypothetical protein
VQLRGVSPSGGPEFGTSRRPRYNCRRLTKEDLQVEILVKPIEIGLQLFWRHALSLWCMTRVVVDVGKDDGLRVLRFDVFSVVASVAD